MPDLLFEIGLEEIPARMIAAAQAELAERVRNLLARENLLAAGSTVESYSTPRRLTIKVVGLVSQQSDVEEVLTGPASSIAFKNGEATPAAHAFARKAGVEVAALTRATTARGEYITAQIVRKGQSAMAVLKAQLPQELAALYWPKNMYWRAGKAERFVRPLRWLLALLDNEIVPVEFAGVVANNKTYGHRILHGDQPIEIGHPSEYLPKLESAFVIADVESRRHKIRKTLDAVARTVPGIRWREDHALVDTVTHLTEWPSVLLGGFEAEYLTLPEEVLVTVMRDHQKYFALEDQSGKLAPYFLAVLNTEADEAGLAVIRHGNERVLRSRFKDARFFWDFDQKIPLVGRVEMLKSVTFQKELGSYWDKTEANLKVAQSLSRELANNGRQVDERALLEATKLAKTDLTTELVKEFTELQGIVGGSYAVAQGLGEQVAEAIYYQYRPAFATDAKPEAVEAKVLGLADRLTTIFMMFQLGLEPTGSRDPFALRRAGNAVIWILAQDDFPLSFSVIRLHLQFALSDKFKEAGRLDESKDIVPFLKDRLKFLMEDTYALPHGVINGAFTAGLDEVSHILSLASDLNTAKDSADFAAISGLFKRIKNILRQAGELEWKATFADVKESLLTAPAERALYDESVRLAPIIDQLRDKQRYLQAFEQIATLRPHVDRFFDTVMVMAPEPELRRNRLALIASVRSEFSKIADFSEIVTS